jgi:hypothetical protein
MFEISLLPLILQAWLEYLRLEDLSNAEVDKGTGIYQCVFDEEVQVVGNKVLLSRTLFARLKQMAQHSRDRNHLEESQIALALPAIYRVRGKGKDQRLKYYPLFTIDLSWILKGTHRQGGWSLLECSFYPVAPNLIEFCALEEPAIDSLIVNEGILTFIRDAFGRSFSTLQDFLNQVDLPSGCKSDRTAYLLLANLATYNNRLKQDLRLINQQFLEEGEACAWLHENHPANLYLRGEPLPSHPEILFWAAFPGTVPDKFQSQAIKQTQTNRLVAVSGGPGSGKTELHLYLLTQVIFERARAIARGEPDCNSLCVFASTNNSAIEKFQHRLHSRFPTHLFYLLGGNRRDIIPNRTLPRLRAGADWLQNQTFNAAEYTRSKAALVQAESELRQKLEAEPELQRQQLADMALLTQIEADLEVLQTRLESEHSTQGQDDRFSNFPLEAYRQIKSALEQAQAELTERASLFKRLADWMLFNTPKAVFSRLERRIRPAWAHTQSTAFPFQLPISLEQLQAAIAEVTEQLRQAEKWQSAQSVYQQQQSLNVKIQRQIADLKANQQAVQARLSSYPTEDFYTRFYQEHHQLQVRIFESAWELLQQEALRRQPEILATLRTYEQVLLGDEQAILDLKLNPHQFYRNLSLVFPVVSSSLQSIANLFPVLDVDLIRLAMLDEAGATPVHQPFPLLVRSQQAVVVGDPQQLRPITNLCADTIEVYWRSAFQAQNLGREIYSHYAPTALNTATAYHRAAGANSDGDLGSAILLANHYRSVPLIVAFCSPNYPGGLVSQTQPRPSLLGTNLLSYHVEGRQEYQTNPEEVKAVATIVKILLQAGYELGKSLDSSRKTIGVMSPFFHQSAALRHRLQDQWKDFPWTDIGTIHQFQGGEKAVIIFSPYHCDRNYLSFLNRYSNLLNTAVSRAEELFILVGNLEELDAAGGETRRLVHYIQQFGEMRSLP